MERWRRVVSLPVWYMLLSAASLAACFLFIKMGSDYYPVPQLVFVRFFIGLLCVIPLLFIEGTLKNAVKVVSFRPHLLRAFVVLVSQYCLFYFLSKSNLLSAAILTSIAPLFIPLFNKLFFKGTLTRASIIGEVISIMGVILVFHPQGRLFHWITLIGLLSSILWALSQSIFAYTVKKEGKDASFFYLFFLVSLFSLPGLFLPMGGRDLSFEPLYTNVGLILLGIGIFSFLNQYFRGVAYSLGDAAKLTTLLYFSVFVAAFLDWIVYNEMPTMIQSLGALLVIIGGFFSIYLQKAK